MWTCLQRREASDAPRHRDAHHRCWALSYLSSPNVKTLKTEILTDDHRHYGQRQIIFWKPFKFLPEEVI